jgi:hypothetical protein
MFHQIAIINSYKKIATYIATKCNYAQSSLGFRVSHRLPFFHPTYVVVFSGDLPRFLFPLDNVVSSSSFALLPILSSGGGRGGGIFVKV